MSAQMTYGYFTPIGQPGGIYDLAPFELNAFFNEADDGAVKFGMGVVSGTSAGNSATVGDGEFEGIVSNRRTNEHGLRGGVTLYKGCTLGVMRYGLIYGLLASSGTDYVEVAYGDKVYMVTSGNDAGCFTNVATGNKEIAAKFRGKGSDGIALIELFNQEQPTA